MTRRALAFFAVVAVFALVLFVVNAAVNGGKPTRHVERWVRK